MKHIIHGKTDTLINYDALAEFETFGSEVILTTYGPRCGARGYICLDRDELRSLLVDLLNDLCATPGDYQYVIGRLSKTR